MLEFIFWFSVFMIFYAYFGYPSCLMAILGYRKVKSLFSSKEKKDLASTLNHPPYTYNHTHDDLPSVSFIITAYNEEKRIEDKIKNSLALNYPKDNLEIIVASDCSSDNTDEIVNSYSNAGVRLVRAPERKGKENAQKHAVDASSGEILVFSDVATILKPDAIQNIVGNFSDPTIGCVSSEDRFIDKDGNVSGEGAYVRYEMFLRNLETKVNTLVGLSGSFFAARRTVCENWATDLQSDFNTLLNSIKIGLRGVSDPKSIGYYQNIADEKKEFQRKVRTVLRGISVLMRNLSLLNPKKYGMFAWQLFSHKLCRWLVPFFMILAFLSNFLIVINSGSFILVFIAQLLFYTTAIFYYLIVNRDIDLFLSPDNIKSNVLKKAFKILTASALKLIPITKLSYFFTIVNCSILVAWFSYFKGQRATFWEPSKR
ncbi:glycosyltransferase family 2 protein [Desulfosarcina ovata]|uniref:Glycosyl transferase n=1 Tax=Desulfosarcina ovata subsp. ovata TaxID=2752305 RepID=A0A5K8A860_9BACT|nr:glycosyltransferase family 2 protein [Desulfosarcina ovata]BBO88544.1 glycosyl transferase [Desulfosarcina ovata subsp. ovata]